MWKIKMLKVEFNPKNLSSSLGILSQNKVHFHYFQRC